MGELRGLWGGVRDFRPSLTCAGLWQYEAAKVQERRSLLYLRLFFLWAALLVPCIGCTPQGPGRRALIIGINQYARGPQSARAGNLKGAVNDARAIAKVLRARHGFATRDIRMLLDGRATRGAILGAIKRHLIAPARPGQISLFFYAGHGSWLPNPTSSEPDRRDETIVPVDSSRGAADIHDKELATLFNQIVERGAVLTAIFDSCHSGSIARGLPGTALVRSVPPGAPSPSPPLLGPPPEKRGALILSAAQDRQIAQERYLDGQHRGLFTSALEQVLATAPAGESAGQMFSRIRALMQERGSAQEPVLAGTQERRRQTLWGAAADSGTKQDPNQTVIAVSEVHRDHVILQAGLAIGLQRFAELRSHGKEAPVRLRVTAVLGPSQSRAEVLQGALQQVRSGDLYTLERPGAPEPGSLRLFLDETAPDLKSLEGLARELAQLAASAHIDWVTDPTETAPTHVLSFAAGGFVLRDQQSQILSSFGASPRAEQVLSALRRVALLPRLFLQLPLPGALRRDLDQRPERQRLPVLWVPRAEEADYLLIGRWQEERIEYAWVLPQADAEAPPGPLPVRSRWLSARDAQFLGATLAAGSQLARIHAWHALAASSHPAEEDSFPYQLALRSRKSGALLARAEPLRGQEDYQPVLTAKSPLRRVQPRYVYLFNLDSEGRGALIFPPPTAGNVENLLPAESEGPGPLEITLGEPFHIEEPYGWESFFLLTSDTAIPHPDSAFSFSGVRGVLHKAPAQGAQWSIDRLIMRSQPP